jgi:hypothetical protein
MSTFFLFKDTKGTGQFVSFVFRHKGGHKLTCPLCVFLPLTCVEVRLRLGKQN